MIPSMKVADIMALTSDLLAECSHVQTTVIYFRYTYVQVYVYVYVYMCIFSV